MIYTSNILIKRLMFWSNQVRIKVTEKPENIL